MAYIKVRVENDGRFSKHNTLKVHGRCRSDRTSNGPKDVLDRRATSKNDLFPAAVLKVPEIWKIQAGYRSPSDVSKKDSAHYPLWCQRSLIEAMTEGEATNLP